MRDTTLLYLDSAPFDSSSALESQSIGSTAQRTFVSVVTSRFGSDVRRCVCQTSTDPMRSWTIRILVVLNDQNLRRYVTTEDFSQRENLVGIPAGLSAAVRTERWAVVEPICNCTL